jgi:RNA polymerase sigma factor (sigma-70 family)
LGLRGSIHGGSEGGLSQPKRQTLDVPCAESPSEQAPPRTEPWSALIERLFREQGRALLGFFARRVRNQVEGAELAQEVWKRMLQIEDPASIRDPEAYLFTVARNLARRHGTTQRRAQRDSDVDDPDVAEQLAVPSAAGAEIDAQQRAGRLHQVLAELSPKARAAVALQYWHDQSYEQIAQQLGVSIHMVKKYHSQALALLRRRMGRLR